MTLYAVAIGQNKAQILTDCIAYDKGVRSFGYVTKFEHLLHIDSVAVVQGDGLFGDYVDMSLKSNSDLVSFEHAADQLERTLPHIAEMVGRDDPSTVALVGWSESEQRFRGLLFDSEAAYIPVDIDQPFAFPMPYDRRPTALEVHRLLTVIPELTTDPKWIKALDDWFKKAPLEAPRDYDEWRALGIAAHMARTLDSAGSPLQVMVAGQLHLTTIRRGEISSRRIYTFDTSIDDLTRGTWHPHALIRPCDCGSGNRSIDCCVPLRNDLDGDCWCGTGKTLRDCHAALA